MTENNKVRKYPRVKLAKIKLIAWEHLGERNVSAVRILGMGGMFISTPTPPPSGDFIKLVFEAPEGDIRARGLICDSRAGHGMGVQFVSMGHECRARLNRLMNALAAN